MDQAEQNSLRKCVQHQIQQERSDTLHRVKWKSACRFEFDHSKIEGNPIENISFYKNGMCK